MRIKLSRQLASLPSAMGISANAVARLAGLDYSNFSKILHGRYSYGVDTLLRIVDACGYELRIEKKL